MSATRTQTVLKSSAFVSGDAWDATVAEAARQNADIAAYCGLQPDLGGSETEGVLTSSFEAVPGAREYVINGDTLGGLTLEVLFWVITTSASTSVQARLRNTTDSSNAALGTASSSTSLTAETKTVTLASGPKTYRLELVGGNTDAPVAGFAYLRFRKVAA